jgi:hypothetical protein
MDSENNSYNKRRSNQYEGSDDEIGYEESKELASNRLTQLTETQQIILSSNQIHSYLNRETQMVQENFNEQISAIQKMIIQETNCPDILPFETELYKNLCEIVKNQV